MEQNDEGIGVRKTMKETLHSGAQGKREVKRQEVVNNMQCCMRRRKLLAQSTVTVSSCICSSATVRRDDAGEFHVNKFIN